MIAKKEILETRKERNRGQPGTSLLPLLPSAHLLVQPASDVHWEVGIPSECIAPLSKGVHLAYCPGGLLRREGQK